MSDKEIRRLERLAEQGDKEAKRKLLHIKVKLSGLDEIRREVAEELLEDYDFSEEFPHTPNVADRGSWGSFGDVWNIPIYLDDEGFGGWMASSDKYYFVIEFYPDEAFPWRVSIG